MKWVNISDELPQNIEDVLVSDGHDGYTVAWYRKSDETWHAASDMLDADNYDGGCHITVDSYNIRWWSKIKKLLPLRV